MGEWRYIAARLNGDGTESILDTELPLTSPSLTKNLSGADGLSGRITPALARLLGPDGQPVIEPWSTAIFSEESGQIRHGAIVNRIQKDGAELAITGIGFTGAIKGQPYTGSSFFVEKDALDIARHIWYHWQSFEGGNLGLTIDASTKTGILVGTELRQAEFDTVNGPVSFESGPYKLNDRETDDLGAKFDALATDYHFDYAESHSWNSAGDGFDHRLDFGVPRIGTRKDRLRFVVGENVFGLPSEAEESDAYASAVLVRGAGEGATMNRSLITRAAERRLRRIYIHTDKTLKSVKSTQNRGLQYLPMLEGRSEVSSFMVYDHPHAPLGSWREGDEVELQTDTEWGDTAMWVRILSTTITPEAPNVAAVSVVRADKIPS